MIVCVPHVESLKTCSDAVFLVELRAFVYICHNDFTSIIHFSSNSAFFLFIAQPWRRTCR